MSANRHPHWRVSVETSGEQIVAIEPEMLAGREISEADEDAIRTAARHLLAFVGSPTDEPDIPVQDAVIATIWRAAMTVAANIVIKHENDANDDDAPMRVIDELSSCVRGIKKWMEVDEVYLEELRPMVRAVLPPSPIDGEAP